jgi:hypothetical protein
MVWGAAIPMMEGSLLVLVPWLLSGALMLIGITPTVLLEDMIGINQVHQLSSMHQQVGVRELQLQLLHQHTISCKMTAATRDGVVDLLPIALP